MRPAHFGIDCCTLTERPYANSVNFYVGQILSHLRLHDPNRRFTCFTKGAQYPVPANLREMRVDWNQPRGSSFVWRHIALPIAIRRARIDVMWFPYPRLPFFAARRSVVTVHDLSFLRLPQRFSRKGQMYLEGMLRRAVAQCDHIIAISEFTASELTSVLRVPRDRITVVHHGTTPAPDPPSDQRVNGLLTDLGITKPFFLFLDGSNSRKNLGLLLQMLKSVPTGKLADIQFVVTGQVERLETLFRAAGLAELLGTRVIFPGIVPPGDLEVLFRRARALLYLSEYEGFGLPILEAFERECPVIALRASSLPEVAGDGALLVNPTNVAQLREAVFALENSAVRRELMAAGKKQTGRFSWQRAADQILETIMGMATK